MLVKDLIKRLEAIPQDADVSCNCRIEEIEDNTKLRLTIKLRAMEDAVDGEYIYPITTNIIVADWK